MLLKFPSNNFSLTFHYPTDGCSVAENWSVYSQNCYSCISDTLSWYDARSSCQKLGADLVTISNAGTQSFLESMNIYISTNSTLIEHLLLLFAYFFKVDFCLSSTHL